METIKLTREYTLTECATCGCSFALLSSFIDMLRKSGRDFYCPSSWGHSMSFGAGEVAKLEKEIEELKSKPPKIIEREIEVVVEIEKEPKDLAEFYRDHEHNFSNGKNNPCRVCGVFKGVAGIVNEKPLPEPEV